LIELQQNEKYTVVVKKPSTLGYFVWCQDSKTGVSVSVHKVGGVSSGWCFFSGISNACLGDLTSSELSIENDCFAVSSILTAGICLFVENEVSS
jgi:hypothetical protein